MRAEEREDFREFVAARQLALRRTAYLLCGDWHFAQDLVQQTLTKLYVAWSRVRSSDSVDAYARRILARTYVDEYRKRSYHETPVAEMPEHGTAEHEAELRVTVMAALRELSPRQRAVVTLRFWEDMSVEAVAAALGMNPNTVKSDTARALSRLRTVLGQLVDEYAIR
jgi:RNA polymerase sigma-70 factor (sigma-E family)